MSLDFLYPKIHTFLTRHRGIDVKVPADHDKYAGAVWVWSELERNLREDRQSREEFVSTLSPAQVRSWEVLDDWWNGRYDTYGEKKGDHVEKTVQIIREAERRFEENPRENKKTETYRDALGYLFVVDMVWFASVGGVMGLPAGELQGRLREIVREIGDKISLARRRAVKHASWQMVGFEADREVRGVEDAPGENRVALGSTVQACPWLDIEGEMRKPFYLWDRFARKTVQTDSLPEKEVAYYCISHTWGRWRKKSIKVDGVDWLVPTNTRFKVLSLPETFRNLDWPVRYIWFDLFCIPQEECPQQAEEIGKQAEIFRQAKSSVIWAHDVLGWGILESAILWLGLNYLQRTMPEDTESRDRFETFSKTLNEQSSKLVPAGELLNPWAPTPDEEVTTSAADLETTKHDPGSKWFSSLWTLQEAYLCPSALLADRNWQFISVGKRLMLTLDNISSLAYSPASELEGSEAVHRPGEVEVLMFTMKRWELSDLSSPSRMSLFIAAKSRVSTGPRAEAIMSALGVKDWFETYRRRHGHAHPQKNLVLDSYPLDFLVEAQHKIGGPFFLHHRSPQNTIRDAELGKPLGTLLPLAHNTEYWQVTQSMNFQSLNWSKSLTDDWEIQLDGSLVIKQAAILVGGRHELPNQADGPISISSPDGYQHFHSFRTWMDGLPTVPYRFAVAVVRYSHRQFGIVLEGVRPTPDESRLALVKTGIFMTDGRWCGEDLIQKSSTDWLVL